MTTTTKRVGKIVSKKTGLLDIDLVQYIYDGISQENLRPNEDNPDYAEVDPNKTIKIGKRVGVLVARRVSDDVVNIGWSICNPKDKFDKHLGLKIAIGRTGDNCSPIPVNFYNTYDIEHNMNILVIRSMRYFGVNNVQAPEVDEDPFVRI